MKKLLMFLAIFTLSSATIKKLKGHTVVCMKSSLALSGADQQLACYRHLNVRTIDDYSCYIRLGSADLALRSKIAAMPSSYKVGFTPTTVGTGLNMTAAGKLTSASGNPVAVTLPSDLYSGYSSARTMYAVPANGNQKEIGSAFGTKAQIVTSVQDAISRLGSSMCQ